MRTLNWPNLMTTGVTGHLVTRAYEEYCGGMSIHKPKFISDSNEAFDYWRGFSDGDGRGSPFWYSINTLLRDAESLKNGLPNIVPTINDDDDELVEVWSNVNQIVIIAERIRECENYDEFLELAKLLVTEGGSFPFGQFLGRSYSVSGFDWDVYITLEIRLSLEDEYFRWGSYYNDGDSNIHESQAILQNIEKLDED
tara:strand:+ start:82 stop:672 length:591 start_codon:yes stop_codon:yes gene_type:complete